MSPAASIEGRPVFAGLHGGDRLGHLEETLAKIGAFDPVVGAHEFKRLALAHRIPLKGLLTLPLCRLRMQPPRGGDLVGHIIEKVIDVDLQSLGEVIETAGTDAIRAALILLHLLKGEADCLTQLFLAQTEQSAPLSQAGSYMRIHRVGSTCATPPDSLLPGHVSSCMLIVLFEGAPECGRHWIITGCHAPEACGSACRCNNPSDAGPASAAVSCSGGKNQDVVA